MAIHTQTKPAATELRPTRSFVWMVSPDRNSWQTTPRHPERLESSFYGGWLYVETACVFACVFARFWLTEIVLNEMLQGVALILCNSVL